MNSAAVDHLNVRSTVSVPCMNKIIGFCGLLIPRAYNCCPNNCNSAPPHLPCLTLHDMKSIFWNAAAAVLHFTTARTRLSTTPAPSENPPTLYDRFEYWSLFNPGSNELSSRAFKHPAQGSLPGHEHPTDVNNNLIIKYLFLFIYLFLI